jgi:hypothetical protein
MMQPRRQPPGRSWAAARSGHPQKRSLERSNSTRLATLYDLKPGDVFVGLTDLCELSHDVIAIRSEFECADSARNVGLDIRDSIDLCQRASHGGRTGASSHARQF